MVDGKEEIIELDDNLNPVSETGGDIIELDDNLNPLKKKENLAKSPSQLSSEFIEPIPEGGLGAPLNQPSIPSIDTQAGLESAIPSTSPGTTPYSVITSNALSVISGMGKAKELKTVSQIKKEGGKPTLDNYIASGLEHAGEFLQEGIGGIAEGLKTAKQGAKMIKAGIQPTAEDIYNINKEYPNNLALRGAVKILAGVGGAAFSGLMHFTPTGAIITEGIKGIETR